MNNQDCTLGIDLGGTKILAGVVDARGRVLDRAKRKTRADLGLRAVLDRIARTAREAIEQAGVEPERVVAVGIGVPGPIDSEAGIVMEAPNLGFVDFNMREFLERETGLPTVVFNDVNAGTWGEFTQGAGRGSESCLGVFVGTGIGSGLIVNRQLYEGAGGVAGEIGHMCLSLNGPLCGCGRHGCLEAMASRVAITRDIWTAIGKGQKSVLTTMIEKRGGQIRSGQLKKAYDQGDKVVTKALNRAAKYLGAGLASAASLLNPECIVLGGGVLTALGEPYLERVRAAMAAHTFQSVMASTRLVLATLGDDAGLIGAADLARRRYPVKLRK